MSRSRIPEIKEWLFFSTHITDNFRGTLSEALQKASVIAFIESGWPSAINKTVCVRITSAEPKCDTFVLTFSTPNRQKRNCDG